MGKREVRIRPVSGRALAAAREKPSYFGKARQEVFLAALAASCNVKASAEKAGVGKATAYRRRYDTPAFAAAWDEAIEVGYARLEAALIERAIAGAETPEVRVDEDDPMGLATMPAEQGMRLLADYRRRREGGRRREGRPPGRVDLDAVYAKIEKKLKVLGMRVEAEE